MDIFFEEGIFNVVGDEHKKHRSVMAHSFTFGEI